jgi:CRP/FNR family transcriptional regulator, nitrogen fixation regulation protein
MQTITATAGRQFTPAMLALHGPAAAMVRRPGAEGVRRSVAKGEELYAEGDAASFFYKVVSGTVRICKVLNDGRRQIEAFHLCGDIFGLERGATHRFTAEAIDDLVVIAYRAHQLDELVRDNPDLGSQVMSSVLTSLDRARDHMVLLGRKSAREKIASFLLDIAERLNGGDRFDLPMQRADIADHLGLTIETVSRTLTQLARDGLIGLAACGRTVALNERRRLQTLKAQ